ncbi:hypothetical protein TNCV_705611 [Trichonephila clavipes]|nr:hypothetical protein TNCV_705611 [Trichonephila clavipes]
MQSIPSGKWHGIYGVPVPETGRTSSSELINNRAELNESDIRPFLPHIKDLSKRFFDKLPSVPNELITNQPAYDPASGKWHGIYGVPVPKRDVPPHQN